MSLSHLLEQKDIRTMNRSVFEWLDVNTVEPSDFLAYVQRVNNEADHNGQCGAAIDYICEKLIKQGQLSELVDQFGLADGVYIAPVIHAVVINHNKSVEQFFNAALDDEKYGPYILNKIGARWAMVKQLWHQKFINNSSVQRAIKHNSNLASILLSCWDADTDKKALRFLVENGCIAPSLLVPQLKNYPTTGEKLLTHWIELFPQYIENNVYEIAQHLTPKAFEHFFDNVIVPANPKIVALCLEKFGAKAHQTSQHLCAQIDWGQEAFDQVYDAAVCQPWEPHQSYSPLPNFVDFWFNNTPEHAQHFIDECVRYSGEGFSSTTQALIERMRISKHVHTSGSDGFKRKI